MKAGFFETDITPPIGMEKPGGYEKAYTNAINDPLKARAVVLDDGKECVALVGIDTICIDTDTVSEVRERIEKQCGIKGASILIAASHTHTGGPLCEFSLSPEYLEDASPLVRDLVLNNSIVADQMYRSWVIAQISTAVCEAHRRMEKAVLSAGKGHEEFSVYNRRLRMKNGRTYTHPGKGNPDIIGPAGPIDPDVGVLAAWRPDGTLLGCIVNYACHGTTFQSQVANVSADWIHCMEKTIRGVMGKEVVAVFLNGACGDITQVDNMSTREREFGLRWSRLVGTRVGAEAVKVLVTAEKGNFHPLRVVTKTLRLRRRPPSAKSLKECRRIIRDKKIKASNPTQWAFAKERLILEYVIKKQPTAALEVQAIQVGPVVYLANPAEYFCQYGLDIKKRSPFHFTFVVELANGLIGYVPTEDAFLPSGGGYETVLTSYSNLETTAGTKIADACVGLAKRLKPGRVPRGKQVKWSGKPWDYGILGPELK